MDTCFRFARARDPIDARPGRRRLAQGGDSSSREGQRLFAIREHALVLQFAHLGEDLAEDRAWLIPCGDQIPACQQRDKRLFRLDSLVVLLGKVMVVEQAVAGKAIEPVQLQVVLEIRLFDESPQSGAAHVPHVRELHVVSDQRQHALLRGVRKPQPLADGLDKLDAALDMPVKADAIRPCELVDRLEDEGFAWAQRILEHSPLAIRLLKSAFNADVDGQAGLQELAGNATLLFYMTEQGQEGRDAYLEKRKPDFRKYPWLPW